MILLVTYFNAYPQAPIEKEMYIKIPAGINITEGARVVFV